MSLSRVVAVALLFVLVSRASASREFLDASSRELTERFENVLLHAPEGRIVWVMKRVSLRENGLATTVEGSAIVRDRKFLDTTTSADGDNRRVCSLLWDGEKSVFLDEDRAKEENARKRPTAEIDNTISGFEAGANPYRWLYMCTGAFRSPKNLYVSLESSEGEQRPKTLRFYVREDQETILIGRVFFDGNSLPVKIESNPKSKIANLDARIDWEKQDGVWVPSRVECIRYMPPKVSEPFVPDTKIVFDKIVFHSMPVDEKAFAIVLPIGTLVTDYRISPPIRYLIESARTLVPDLSVALRMAAHDLSSDSPTTLGAEEGKVEYSDKVSLAQEKESEPEALPQPRSDILRLLLSSGVALVLLLASTLALFRRRKRKSLEGPE